MKISTCYLEGIRDGRALYRIEGLANAAAHLDNLNRTIRQGFSANSPVGQMLRGERDFWRNRLKKVKQ